MTPDGFVLAGGRSRRFGQDKALVTLDGTTLVERAVRTLSGAGCERVVVLHRDPHLLKFVDCEIEVDIGGGRGPLDGLHTALSLARSDVVITLPVDQVCVTTEVVRRLLDVANDDLAYDLVAACDDEGSRHHLTALWRRSACLDVVARHVAHGESSPRRVLDDLRCRWEEFPASLMLNVNRVEDLPTLRSTLRSEIRPNVADGTT